MKKKRIVPLIILIVCAAICLIPLVNSIVDNTNNKDIVETQNIPTTAPTIQATPVSPTVNPETTINTNEPNEINQENTPSNEESTPLENTIETIIKENESGYTVIFSGGGEE